MKYFTFENVVEEEAEDEGYSAYSPTLPGRFSNGKTVDEAKKNIRQAIHLHMKSIGSHPPPNDPSGT